MSGTEMLISIMEKFQEAEPTAMMVVWLDEAGDLCSTCNCGDVNVVGMAEYMKAAALKRLTEQ